MKKNSRSLQNLNSINCEKKKKSHPVGAAAGAATLLGCAATVAGGLGLAAGGGLGLALGAVDIGL